MKGFARRFSALIPAVLLLGAGVWQSSGEGSRCVLYLVDRSASMGRDLARLSRAQVWRLEAECARMHPADRLAVAVFGSGVELVLEPTAISVLDLAALRRALSLPRPGLDQGSRLDARAAALVALLDGRYGLDEVCVVSDGELDVPAEIAPSGLPWSWIEWRSPEPDDCAVELERWPSSVPPGAALRCRVRYAKRGELRGRAAEVSIEQDGRSIGRRTLASAGPDDGAFELELAAPDVGATRITVVVAATGDVDPANDRAEQTVLVDGTRRVAWIGAGSTPRSGALVRFEPIAVETVARDLEGFDGLWIDEVPSRSLPAEAIARFVERGGGLVLSGLERQLESGGYDLPPWAELLPVEADPSGGVDEVFVLLDASGSMAAGRFEEAVRALDDLRIEWGLGVRVRAATFAEALSAWRELKARGAAEAERGETVFAACEPRGSTHLARSVEAALAARAGARAAIFLLTDGREEDTSVGDPLAAARALAGRAEREQVRIYALAVGADSDRGLAQGVDLAWLRALTGDGRCGFVRRAKGVADVAAAIRSGLGEGRIERRPVRLEAIDLPAGFPRDVGELSAHRRARLRTGSAAVYATAGGAPVVARALRGAGRVVWIAADVPSAANALDASGAFAAAAHWSSGESRESRLEVEEAGSRRVLFVRRNPPPELGAVRATWSPESGEARVFELWRSGERSFEALLPGAAGGSIDVAGVGERAVPAIRTSESSPFAPRWLFRGLAAQGAPRERRAGPEPGALGLAIAAGAVAFWILRWGRGSSRARS